MIQLGWRLGLLLWALIGAGALYGADNSVPPASPIRFVTQHFQPFSYIEQGQVAGPARALIDAVCQALAQRCEHQLLPWERAQRLVGLGEAEALYVIGWNLERSQRLRFSSPLFSAEYGFFVQGDDPLHQLSSTALTGYRVAALKASNTLSSLRALQQQGHQLEIIEVNDSETAFRLLAVGRVTAVYSNREVGQTIIRQLQLPALNYALRHRQLDYFVGFNSERISQAWVDTFNHQLLRLQQQGQAQKILERYGLQ